MKLSLLPLDWVVLDSPHSLLSSVNGSAAKVMWALPDGWVALRFADGAKAGEAWELRAENLRKFCPLDESGYWESLWDACLGAT